MLEVWSFWKDGCTGISKVRSKEKAEALARTLIQDPDCLGVDIYRKTWCGPSVPTSCSGDQWAYIPVKWRQKARLRKGQDERY